MKRNLKVHADTPSGICYILQFSKPLTRTNKEGRAIEVKFYTGFVSSPERLEERLKEHASGRGSRICAAACEAGSSLILRVVIPNCTLEDEKRIKKYRGVERLISRLSQGRVRTSWARSLSPIMSYGQGIAVHQDARGQLAFYESAISALYAVYSR